MQYILRDFRFFVFSGITSLCTFMILLEKIKSWMTQIYFQWRIFNFSIEQNPRNLVLLHSAWQMNRVGYFVLGRDQDQDRAPYYPWDQAQRKSPYINGRLGIIFSFSVRRGLIWSIWGIWVCKQTALQVFWVFLGVLVYWIYETYSSESIDNKQSNDRKSYFPSKVNRNRRILASLTKKVRGKYNSAPVRWKLQVITSTHPRTNLYRSILLIPALRVYHIEYNIGLAKVRLISRYSIYKRMANSSVRVSSVGFE